MYLGGLSKHVFGGGGGGGLAKYIFRAVCLNMYLGGMSA